MARIVSLGSALQDLYLIDNDDFVATKFCDAHQKNCKSVFGELLIGTKVDIDRLLYEIGGGGTNAAVEFARHGHESIYFGNIGHDMAGDAVLACLDEEGVDNSYVEYAPRKSTGCSVILLDRKSGERTILTYRGASAKFDNLDEEDLERVQPDWLYVTSLRGDMDTLLRFFEKAKEIGCQIMFNPGKLELAEKKKLIGLLDLVDILLVNKSEAAEIVPGTVLTELVSHLGNYVKTVVITDGNMGAIATDGVKTYRFGIYEDVPVKDTTGAGDAFGAGFLAHLAAGYSFRDSLIFASANSTAVVSEFSAKKGLLTGSEKLHEMPIQEVKQ
ncbi:carbohydrate kinase family protein [Candidatus Saccharibacteria bacterium]|nr:carbohydrate kinase family protein [Candidatus Saccharibacteria bacterium]